MLGCSIDQSCALSIEHAGKEYVLLLPLHQLRASLLPPSVEPLMAPLEHSKMYHLPPCESPLMNMSLEGVLR